ncbi:MAG: AAA family ATPase [Bacteroidota bacterium]|nr:AAA family ATPase [Bacteroidota bacterium]
MSVLVDRLRISGFRGIEDIEISLSRTTLLIGVNNSGKTSVIRALQLALGDYSRYLTDDDFHIAHDDTRCEEIVVDVRIVPSNTEGKRNEVFSEDWIQEFGSSISVVGIEGELGHDQFLAVRTVARPDSVKGGFVVKHYALDNWPPISSWKSERVREDNRIRRRYEALPFITVDAQRDIHQELRDRTSFVGKILSSVKYDASDVSQLEGMIAEINQKAVAKSEPLKGLKTQLDTLNQSFEGSGQAELTPFPKKIRDLAKRFSIHFGESDQSSFSMEYHGMGTRSWASMLTVKAFVELMADNHEQEANPFFPIIAVEEPESHLHPNAQRTLYRQMRKNIQSQIIVSTHSPYLPAISSLDEIRMLKKTGGEVHATSVVDLSAEEKNRLRREIMRFRGEMFFSRALILAEGPTEERLIPAMFELYHDCPIFEKGVNCIGVGGKNYRPFLVFAFSFDIPVCIISDNDGDTERVVRAQIERIKGEQEINLDEKRFSLEFLGEENNIERELLSIPQLREKIIEAFVALEAGDNRYHARAKKEELSNLGDDGLVQILKSNKLSYADFLSEVILQKPNGRDMIPDAFVKTFETLESWIG